MEIDPGPKQYRTLETQTAEAIKPYSESEHYYRKALDLLFLQDEFKIKEIAPKYEDCADALLFLAVLRDAEDGGIAFDKSEFNPIFAEEDDALKEKVDSKNLYVANAADYDRLRKAFHEELAKLKDGEDADMLKIAQVVRRLGFALWIKDLRLSFKEQHVINSSLGHLLQGITTEYSRSFDEIKVLNHIDVINKGIDNVKAENPNGWIEVRRSKSVVSALVKTMRKLSEAHDKGISLEKLPDIEDRGGLLYVVPDHAESGKAPIVLWRLMSTIPGVDLFKVETKEGSEKRRHFRKLASTVMKAKSVLHERATLESRLLTFTQYSFNFDESSDVHHRRYESKRALKINPKYFSLKPVQDLMEQYANEMCNIND